MCFICSCIVSPPLYHSHIANYSLQVIHIQIKMTNEWKDAIWVTSEDDDNVQTYKCMCVCAFVSRDVCVRATDLFTYQFL